ncbi:TOPRIM nucleotidyl transferase/hydrolase domain-containing protein [uncultured Leifsonia sp.]|uniref:TOPRIM nucleotidyl transferase/hydrolase domain-containing protein n=1 Tax=uncultured Leifsonia sp. TaxID=340359 RepID=UPI0025FA717F|nr:TOPRIM nucleotidyl transferase/hydrolase domain-containing protein [uncultured Leifsonia sp.]
MTRPPATGDDTVTAYERAVAAWTARRDRRQGAPLPGLPAAFTGAVLVEGVSDSAALHAAAGRLGVDPAAAGVAILPMGGAMSVRWFVDRLAPAGVRLHGLCDEAEAAFFRRAGLEDGEISVCRPDLEGELVRALGTARVESVLAREGDLGLFRTFQRQPAQRGRHVAAQLHRFLGTTSGRKEAYGRLLTAELPAHELPLPLGRALTALLDDLSPSRSDRHV